MPTIAENKHTLPRLTYRPEEVCEMLGISRPFLFSLLKSGQLPSKKLGGARLIAAADVLKLAEVPGREAA